jgi:glycosyltransferase involved in cell wall biosynthesis
LIESIASGIPIVASSAGGTPEHISNKMGIIVEPNDEIGFVNAMEWMLGNYSTFDVSYLRKYAVEHFSNEKVGEQFTRIYLEILKP